jgi:hypothetical protein
VVLPDNHRVRTLGLAVLVACGSAIAPPPAVAPGGDGEQAAVPRERVADKAAIDPIAVLAPIEDAPVSWLVPGRIQLELGGSAIEAPGGNRPIDVAIVDRQGNLVRAVVRLEHARFSLWTDSSRLLAVIARDQRVTTHVGPPPPADRFVMLRPGARVRRLAHKDKQTQVRFVGAVEVEGWVPDDVLAESGPRRDRNTRIPSGRRTLMVLPGSVIRVEPKWTAGALATMANSQFLDTVKEIDQAWVEVAYADAEVSLHGYVSKQAPPGRVHRTKDPEVPPPTIIANAKVASGTCLYTKQGGEAAGYIVGDRDVHLDDLGGSWWTLSFDTPWGPIPFAARGPTPTSLVACAPQGSVPPPAGTPSVP